MYVFKRLQVSYVVVGVDTVYLVSLRIVSRRFKKRLKSISLSTATFKVGLCKYVKVTGVMVVKFNELTRNLSSA